MKLLSIKWPLVWRASYNILETEHRGLCRRYADLFKRHLESEIALRKAKELMKSCVIRDPKTGRFKKVQA